MIVTLPSLGKETAIEETAVSMLTSLKIGEDCDGRGWLLLLADREKKVKLDGQKFLSILTDVSKLEDVQSLANATIDHFGQVNLLFNNAGVATGTAIWESTAKDCEWVIGVNLLGVVHCIR